MGAESIGKSIKIIVIDNSLKDIGMNTSNDNDILTARSTAIVLLVLTGLLGCCWALIGGPRLQAATFVCGMVGVVAWLSYCQQKTTSDFKAVFAEKKNSNS